jgi:ketosteroid isomerase-like protein
VSVIGALLWAKPGNAKVPQSREQLEALAVEHYFGNVAAGRIDAMLNIFADDAVMAVPTLALAYEGKAAIAAHFAEFMRVYSNVAFADFKVTADTETQSVAVRFRVTLTPADGGAALVMRNCNFFTVGSDGRIVDVVIYTSATPQEGFRAGSVSR